MNIGRLENARAISLPMPLRLARVPLATANGGSSMLYRCVRLRKQSVSIGAAWFGGSSDPLVARVVG
jgi:hypothetical protein